jgi:hypothetical protein
MDPFTAVALIGAGFQIYGQIQANNAEAEAQELNAEFFEEQKIASEMATRRELDIFDREGDAFFGDQVSAYAKAGVDLSGSILTALVGTKQKIKSERAAIEEQGRLRVKAAGFKVEEAKTNAKRARDSSFFQSIQTIAGVSSIAASRSASRSKVSTGGVSGTNT